MNERKQQSSWILLIAVFLLGFLINEYSGSLVSAVTNKSYENLKVFSDVLYIIQKDYVEETNVDNLVEGAIKGMLSMLDPHSAYMPPDMYREMQVETKGSFGGLGIELTVKDGTLTVVAPIEDTPAFRAGIKAGDQIVKIEGSSTKDMTIMDAVKKLRGKKGTPVTISIMREGLSAPQDVAITRDVIEIKSVKSKIIDDRVGYIRVTQFQEHTGQDFSEALREIEKKVPSLMGLILDMRNNPGGLLEQAVEVSDEFIESGLIVYTEGRTPDQRMEFRARPNERKRDYPIIVLVNAGTASGSEIVAGALQDDELALILGTTTFGKGSVQTVIPLENGAGMRLTTAKYFTPKGRLIHAKGIEPDIVVEDSYEQMGKDLPAVRFIREKDLQQIKEGQEEPPAESKTNDDPVETPVPEGKNDQTSQQPGSAVPSSAALKKADAAETDPPLDRAVELLKTWKVFRKIGNGAVSVKDKAS